ncbi:MAG TPA: zf-HC2 domain-containing protein [Polyangiaceae bacterium]|nr:zf-HC2 domain-containing protein [Polyangiaceae bacterium]
MSTHHTPQARHDCAEVNALLDTFADGELSRELTLDVQQHINHCDRCTAIVESADSLKKHLREAVYEDAAISTDFLARMQGALVAEETRIAESHRVHPLGSHFSPLSWRTIMPLVAAACALFWVNMKRTQPSPAQLADGQSPQAQLPVTVQSPNLRTVGTDSESPKPQHAGIVDTAALDEALDELIDYHSAPPPSQMTEAKLVPQMERDVGVRVHLPNFEGARWAANKDLRSLGMPQWQGATVVPVRNQRAAYFRYNVGGHWVTLYMYNSGRFPVHRKLEERVVRDLPVYVGERRGYSIAARERKGIGYAVATDFNGTDSAELVASIH